MRQMRYSVVNRIRLSDMSAVSQSGIASLRPVRSDLACLMNHTGSMLCRPILSASSNETACDLSNQIHADAIHMLVVCHFSNRTNDSPSVRLGPIVNVPDRSPSPFLRSRRSRQGADQLSLRGDLAKRCKVRSPNADISPDQTTWSGPRRNVRLT